jgi:hypothetical protein
VPPHCRDAPWGVSGAAVSVPGIGSSGRLNRFLRLGDAPRGVSTVGAGDLILSKHPLSCGVEPSSPRPSSPILPPTCREKREKVVKSGLSPSLPADGREAGREGLGSEGSGGAPTTRPASLTK